MKRPSFVLYAAFYAVCMMGCCFGIMFGVFYDLPFLLVLAGEAAVWSSMIFDRYHKRLRDYLEYERDLRNFSEFVTRACYPGTAPEKEVQQDVV